MFAEAMARALAANPDVLVFNQHPQTGQEAVDTVIESRPDVLLLDYWLPGLGTGSPTVIEGITAAVPDCKIIVLCWLHGPRELESALQAGAAGFLPKSLGVEEVTEAIRQAFAGRSPVLPKELERVRTRLTERNTEGYKEWERAWARLRTLSRREVEVLVRLSEGRRVEHVAEDLFISVRTVRNHIHKILEKTGATTQLEAVAIARHYRLIP